MKQYKTVPISPMVLTNVKVKDFYTNATLEKSVSNITHAIAESAAQGWLYTGYVDTNSVVYRKVGLFEKHLGPIPIIGVLFRRSEPTSYKIDFKVLIFEREV